jgi:hypothetical protein
MKKVLLSLSLLAATVFAANAQNFKIWDANDGTAYAGFGTPYIFTPGSNSFTVDTATSAPYIITASGSTTGYYVNGFGNGSYSSTGSPQPFGYTAANFATDKLFLNINAPGTQVKVQFSTFTAGVQDADIYGKIFDLSTLTGSTFTDQSALLSTFSKLTGANSAPDDATFLTAALAQKIGKIEFAINYQANSGVGTAVVKLKNVTIGTSSTLGTQAAAANIGSAVLFPNPTSAQVFANLTLQNPANVTTIVTDLMGKQIATQNFGTVSSLNGVQIFDASALAKGMYTVTYVLDGTPAKAELVVVK